MTVAGRLQRLAGSVSNPSVPARPEPVAAAAPAAVDRAGRAEADAGPSQRVDRGALGRTSPQEATLTDLTAAAALVGSGAASRVVLTGFRSWRGLLTRADGLARDWDVEIVPTVVRGGGYVDIVVRRRETGG